MQRDRYLNLAALAGALTLAAGGAHAAAPPAPTAAAPVGIFTGDTPMSDGAHKGSGSITVSGTGAAAVYTVTATGFDIGGNKDRGYFVYTTLPGDGGITARVLTQSGGNPGGWMKNGVMIRDTADSGSVMAAINYTGAGNNTGPNLEPFVRTKANTGPAGGSFARDLAAGPVWLRVQRQGTTVQTLSSDNGKNWRLVIQGTLPIKANQPVLAGLDASSQSDTVPEMGTLDNVSVSADIVQPSPAGPAGLQGLPGSGVVLLIFDTVSNATGYNIYRRQAGETLDKAVLLTANPTPYGWFIDDNQGKGLPNGTPLVYSVRAVFGTGASATESLDSQIAAVPDVPIPSSQPGVPAFRSIDIGTATPGSTTLAGGVLTITASGQDIWNPTDGFRFVATPRTGDFSLTAKLLVKPATGPGNGSTWVKGGVMIRENLDAGSRNAMVAATSGNGVEFQYRNAYRTGDKALHNDNGTNDKKTTYPQWLRITRAGDAIAGFQSADGTNFTQLGKAVTLTGLSAEPNVFAGLALSAQNDGKLGIAKFDAASVMFQ
jgi:hypothetical protein